MSKLARFNDIVADFADSIDFVTVYVQEAHATDGWRIKGGAFSIAYHRDIDARFKAANILQGIGLKCPLLVDTMSNEASLQYAAVPEAFYVIEEGVITYQGLGPFAYDPDEIRKMIDAKLNKKK